MIFCGNANSTTGRGEVNLGEGTVNNFIKFLNSNSVHNKNLGADSRGVPFFFAIDPSGIYSSYTYCPIGLTCRRNPTNAIQLCKKRSRQKKCNIFANGRKIVWNQVNYKFSRKASETEIRNKLEELGFLWSSNSLKKTNTPKITKKKDPKDVVSDLKKKVEKRKQAEKLEKESKNIVKKYELKGERSIALSWDGYEDLIAGTVRFDEKNYRGTLNLPLPNNDGMCDGTYSLQKTGQGTWQIACSNNMGAAGTLKWVKDGSVTGIGRDHNDKKVKFTVSKGD